MKQAIQLQGVPQAIAAMQNLSRAAQIRGTRIALNAAMGVIKTRVVSNLKRHQDTGLLAKSQRVKVVVPAASRNPAHHDKPAWGLVGAGKGIAKAKVRTAAGKVSVRSIEAAQKSNYKRVVVRGKMGHKISIVKPSRYGHFPEKKHGDLASAANSAGPAAQAKFAAKASQFINAEAAKLASKPRS